MKLTMKLNAKQVLLFILVTIYSCDSSEQDENTKKNHFILDGVKYSMDELSSCSKLVGSERWGAGGGKVNPTTGQVEYHLVFWFQGSGAPPIAGTYNVVGTQTDIVGDVYVHISGATFYLGQSGTVSVTWSNNRPVFKFTNIQLLKGNSGLISTLTGEFKCL